MKTLDIGEVLSLDQLTTLKTKGGFEAVAPYLDPFNPKGCTRQYLEDIYRSGLKLAGFFYETTGGSGQGDSYFTEAQGAQDARFAEQLLASFKGLVPDGVRVWYADDVRLVSVSAFDAYANGIERNATPAQTPGVYGFEDLVRYIQEPVDGRAHRYPNMGPRAFLTYGHPGGLALDGWQHEQVTIDGITVDISDVYIDGWTPKEADMTKEQLIEMLNDPAVAEKINTFIALKEVDAAQAAAIRQMAGTGSHVSDAELARIITVMGVALQKVGADVAPAP
jgi:hypothetical protein